MALFLRYVIELIDGGRSSNQQLQHVGVDRFPILGEVYCSHTDKLACLSRILIQTRARSRFVSTQTYLCKRVAKQYC